MSSVAGSSQPAPAIAVPNLLDNCAEAALNAADPRLAITWPLKIAELSKRDRAHPMLTAGFVGVEVEVRPLCARVTTSSE